MMLVMTAVMMRIQTYHLNLVVVVVVVVVVVSFLHVCCIPRGQWQNCNIDTVFDSMEYVNRNQRVRKRYQTPMVRSGCKQWQKQKSRQTKW